LFFDSARLFFRLWMMAAEGATMDGSRGPVGGVATISLGSDSQAEMFNQRQHERTVSAETPDAAPRFPQNPGGSASICLGGDAPNEIIATRGPVGGADSVVLGGGGSIAEVPESRGPVGGMATIVLGGNSATEYFNQRHEERNAAIETPDAAPRFQQPPGGTASFVLGNDGSRAQCGPARGPVGGEATVVLGCDNSKEIFVQREQQREVDLETPDPISRFQQAPGGTASICLGNASVEAVPCRGPVGGGTTIVFGDDEPAKAFSHREEGCELGEAPVAAQRFQQAPGGRASICLGGSGVVEGVSERGPVGGASTIVIGDGGSAEGFIQQKHGAVETPDAAPRFQQAPGGSTSICLSDQPTTVEPNLEVTRGAVGGVTTILLGCENHANAFSDSSKRVNLETPDAAPRFQQAPGGRSSVSLGGESSEVLSAWATSQNQAQARRAVQGPQTTVVLGAEQPDVVFSRYEQERHAVVETPDAPARFQQDPGGSASICLGASAVSAETLAMRGPVGGQSSIVLGGDDSGEAFRHDRSCASDVMTPNAAPRFQQAPGGRATLELGNEKGSGDLGFAEPTKGPVGGVATIVLGGGNHATTFADYDRHYAPEIVTPNAPHRFQQEPGGSATIQFGSEKGSENVILATPTKGPVGGPATIVLGGDDPSDAFVQNQTPIETPDALQRFTQAPGGTCTVVLGGAVMPHPSNQLRQSPGGCSTLVLGGDSADPLDTHCAISSNKFADGANQNSGNTITDRSSIRLHSAAGGATTICLGYDVSSTPAKKSQVQPSTSPDPPAVMVQASPTPCRVRQSPGGNTSISFCGNANDQFNTHHSSSNHFASGANQNCGNTITDRSTTRLHHAPGGDSSLCLGYEDPAAVATTSSNKFASGANQNSGNTITDRSTTRVHQAPGGVSSVCLGGD